MSILTELKKLTKKKNATVVSQALPDSLDGDGSSSSGGGANVLMLYAINVGTDNVKAYKNPELTEEYESFIEAFNAISDADIIKVVNTGVGEGQYTVSMALDIVAIPDTIVLVAINLEGSDVNPLVPLWKTVEA